MIKGIVLVLLVLITPSIYGYEDINLTEEGNKFILRMLIGDFGYRDCGWCFLSGKIIINTYGTCRHEINDTIIHEVRHAYYFRMMNITDRLGYCRLNNLSYAKNCWELFADDENWSIGDINKYIYKGIGKYND